MVDENEEDEDSVKDRGLSKKERLHRTRVTFQETFAIQKLPTEGTKLAKRNNTSHLVVFGLTLLLSAFRKNKFANSTELLDMLDPMVRVIRDCCLHVDELLGEEMKQKKRRKLRDAQSSAVISTALQVSRYLIRTPLPSRQSYVSDLAKFMFKKLHERSSSDEVGRQCFEALAVIIRYCPFYKLPSSQLKFLLSLVDESLLRTSDQQQAAFTVLKSIVSRKLILPEVYDSIKRVGELMVTHNEVHLQGACASILLQFMLDYPLGPKRFNQHLGFLINNIAYEHATGRQQALEFMHALINKLPQAILDERSEMLFLPLVLRLVNDEDPTCRRMVGEVVKLLLGQVSPAKQDILVELLLKWLQPGSNPTLVRAAAQVAGLAVDALGDASSPTLERVAPDLMEVVGKHIEQGLEESNTEDNSDSEWQPLYYCLLLVEKLGARLARGTFVAQVAKNDVWSRVSSALVHWHPWVRLSASRIVGLHLASLDLGDFDLEATLMGDSKGAKDLSKSICEQLGTDSESLTPALATQSVKNLVFLGLVLHRIPSDPHDDEELDDDETAAQKTALNWLVHRISYLARKDVPILRKGAFQWMAAIGSQLSEAELQPYLIPFLNPLFRVAGDFNNDQVDQNITQTQEQKEMVEIARGVIHALQARVSNTTFVTAYSSVRKKVLSIRDERRQKRKMLPVINPEKAAYKKMQKAVAKKRQRNAKMARLKNPKARKKAKT